MLRTAGEDTSLWPLVSPKLMQSRFSELAGCGFEGLPGLAAPLPNGWLGYGMSVLLSKTVLRDCKSYCKWTSCQRLQKLSFGAFYTGCLRERIHRCGPW